MDRTAERIRRPPAKQIGDSISRHAIEPAAYLLGRLHQPVGLGQFVEDILQNVFGVFTSGDALANKIPQLWPSALDCIPDQPVLVRDIAWLRALRVVELPGHGCFFHLA